MKLTIGEHAGFCFGVRRAVLKAFECAEKQLPCVTLGPLIHNPQEVERLRRAGCPLAEGSAFSVPLSPEEAGELFRRGRG